MTRRDGPTSLISPVSGSDASCTAPCTPHPWRAGKNAELPKLGWSLSTCISDPFPGDAAAAAAASRSSPGEPLAPARAVSPRIRVGGAGWGHGGC